MKTLGTLRFIQPYNFPLMLEVLSRYPYPTVDVTHDSAYWRVLHLEEGLALLKVSNMPHANRPRLLVELVEATGEFHTYNLLARIGRMLGVWREEPDFCVFLRKDHELWTIIGPLRGYRWVTADSVFEALMMTIIEQQIAWRNAQKAQRWLVEWGGHKIDYHGRSYYAFPTPEQIANATIHDLKPLKITFKRMQLMIDLAQKIQDGDLDLEDLWFETAEDIYNTLIGIKGVGHWTATWTVQRTKGVHNFVATNDVALQAAANRYLFNRDGKLSQAEMKTTFARYGQYAGLAAMYILVRWVLEQY